MVIVNPLHWYYRPAHLEHVIGEMRRLGPPRLRAFFDGEVWHCREGTHRLRAAKALGLSPVMLAYAAIRDGHRFDRVDVAA